MKKKIDEVYQRLLYFSGRFCPSKGMLFMAECSSGSSTARSVGQSSMMSECSKECCRTDGLMSGLDANSLYSVQDTCHNDLPF